MKYMCSIRDIMCSSNIGEMEKLGKFNKEIFCYGCGYIKDNTIKYIISTDKNKMIDFIENSSLINQVTTPLHTSLLSAQVFAEGSDDLLNEEKINLAKDIASRYSDDYNKTVIELRQEFENDMREFINEDKFNILEQITTLPSAIDELMFNNNFANKKMLEIDKEGLLWYKERWQIK